MASQLHESLPEASHYHRILQLSVQVRESVKNAATPILPYVGGASSKIAGATGALRNTIKVRIDHMGGFIQGFKILMMW